MLEDGGVLFGLVEISLSVSGEELFFKPFRSLKHSLQSSHDFIGEKFSPLNLLYFFI